jgi:hypothetical protein
MRIMQEQTVEFIRNSKHNMKIWNRKQVSLSVLYPDLPMGVLAFGAMTVTAAVV